MIKKQCPFLQYNKYCTNIYMPNYDTNISNKLCGYPDCEKCPYYNKSQTELKKVLQKPLKRLK